jgi:hypothetical protein
VILLAINIRLALLPKISKTLSLATPSIRSFH